MWVSLRWCVTVVREITTITVERSQCMVHFQTRYYPAPRSVCHVGEFKVLCHCSKGDNHYYSREKPVYGTFPDQIFSCSKNACLVVKANDVSFCYHQPFHTFYENSLTGKFVISTCN